jgi:enoyl-CoA hydratase/carnithine racemase
MNIETSREFGIFRLTLSRPARRNALSAEMYGELTEALREAGADESVRAVLLKGGEHIFSAGTDLEELQSAPEKLAAAEEAFFKEIASFGKPIVARVDGPCVGEAFVMLLYCDLVYANESAALFSMPSSALARSTRFGAAALVARAAGYPKAAEKLLLSEPMTAHEAADMRLITAAVDKDQIENVVAAKISRLAVLPREAVCAVKQLLAASRRAEAEREAGLEASLYAKTAASADAAEALDAFLHGRKPVFRKED